MGRRRVRLLEQERPDGPHLDRLNSETEQADDMQPVAREVLRLQQTGGNEAVGTMLMQRDTTAGQEAIPADSGGAVKATLVLDDRLGVLPLISFSKGQGNEYSVIVPSTDKDPDLMQYSLNGVKIEKAKISTQNYDIELDDAYVTSVNLSGASGERTIRFSLNYAAQNFKKTTTP